MIRRIDPQGMYTDFMEQFKKHEEDFREKAKKMTMEEIIAQRNKTFFNYIGWPGMLTILFLCLAVLVPLLVIGGLFIFAIFAIIIFVFLFQKFKYKQIADKVIDEILNKPKEKEPR